MIKQQDKMRKTISNELKDENLFDAKFIKEILPTWLKDHPLQLENIEDPQEVINTFKNWTTYFKGFNENRKNIYTDKEHSTSIGYRLIHENLPKFLENIERYDKAKSLEVDFSEVQDHFKVDLDEFFTLKGFNQCLTQVGIDRYNQIRGGQSQKGNHKEQGINEKINLYAQQLEKQMAQVNDEKDKQEFKRQKKEVRSCQLEELYKQILSDRDTTSFRFDVIESDVDLCAKIQKTFYLDESGNLIGQSEYTDEKIKEIRSENYNITKKLEESLKALCEADPDKIYIKNDRSITDISQYLFGEYILIKRCLEYYVENEKYPIPEGKKENKKLSDQRQKWLSQSYFSFDEIHSALELYFEQYKNNELNNGQENEKDNETIKSVKEQKEIAIKKPLFGYFTDLKIKKKNEESNKFEDIHLLEKIKKEGFKTFKVLKKYENIESEKIKGNKEDKEIIKAYLDALMNLQHFLKPLHVQLSKRDEKQVEVYEKDSSFCDGFDRLYKVTCQIIPLYNQTRNYLTKKSFSVEKYKLNFENQTLADGWDKNKEPDNTCVILKKGSRYFLGIMNKEHKNLFKSRLPSDRECYKKMDYKLLPGANKMLPKVFFSKRHLKYYVPSEEILKIRNHSSHTKNGKPQKGFEKKNFDIQDMYKMIDFFKESIEKHPDWKYFNFKFSPTKEYNDLMDFYGEVENQGYKITFQDVSESRINQYVADGKLYLFQIYSKDFSSKTRGNPNLQTLYWKALFENSGRGVYQLNGEAELFHRKKSISSYNDEIWKKGHHAGDSKKRQKYPIIGDRRYAKDTYLFHVPITCNFKYSKKVSKFNQIVNTALKKHPDVNIIGIDRGERHLAYYTVINQKGKILEQGSFNKPFGDKDYHKLLEEREKERDQARKSWGTIEKIKDLKAGYLSQVVHKISKLMIEHNAIVIFEDLNFGFKRGRFKFEKQVYQKLEKALIDKLNYLVFKGKKPNELGGLLKPLQLTAKFERFKKMSKQTGFIFYVPAYHTSKVCPSTGFVNLLYPRYETISKAQEFFKKFDRICFNKDEGYFEFHFDYKNFNNKAEGLQQEWVVCSYGKRLENFRDKEQKNQWDTRKVDLTQEIKDLFKGYGIEYENGECFKEQICQQDNSDFFKSLIRLLRLTLQLRNSKIGTDKDWLISPIKGHNGNFFDSRKIKDNSMPKNADANGAYHIALKGLMMLQQLLESKKSDLSNKAWYKFIQLEIKDKKGNRSYEKK